MSVYRTTDPLVINLSEDKADFIFCTSQLLLSENLSSLQICALKFTCSVQYLIRYGCNDFCTDLKEKFNAQQYPPYLSQIINLIFTYMHAFSWVLIGG